MVILETQRLTLRTLELEDIDSLMEIWGDKEVMKYCGGSGTREMELRSLSFYINLQKEKGFSPYGVILKENSSFIGVCGFNPPNNGCDAEFMYHFKKLHWGKGYATEAARACIDYAKKNLPIRKIGASIHPENKDSGKVLIKLGFTEVGMKWCEATNQDEPYFEMIF